MNKGQVCIESVGAVCLSGIENLGSITERRSIEKIWLLKSFFSGSKVRIYCLKTNRAWEEK